jgi:hypothetical protein
MIYEPQPFFNVQAAVTASFINALARAAVDYVRGQGQPWAYYLGYGFGGAALATGIPGAQAILYAIGSGTVKIFFETSPGAATAKIYLDGIEQGDLDLDDEIIDLVEYVINLPNDGQYHDISILNLGSISVDDPTDFLSILAIETVDASLASKETVGVATAVISATIKDAKLTSNGRVKNTQSAPMYLDITGMTIAEIIGYHDAYVAAVDDTTDGVVIGSAVTLNPALPGGIKTDPVAGSDVQEGGLLSFLLTTGYSESIRIPAFKQSLFGADGQSIANEGVVAALTDLLLGEVADPLDHSASDRNGIAFASFVSGKKSFRK